MQIQNDSKRSNKFRYLLGFGFVLIVLFFLLYLQEIASKKESISASVKEWNKSETWDGYNLVEVLHGHGCFIYSLSGDLIRKPPGQYCLILSQEDYVSALLGALGDNKIVKVHRNSVEWVRSYNVAHDIQVSPIDNSIWFLADEYHNRGNRKIRSDAVIGLNKKGEEIFHWSAEKFQREIRKVSNLDLRKIGDFRHFDYYERTHFNSVEIIPENSLYKRRPEFFPGNILVSDNISNKIFILDRKSKKIVWIYAPGKGSHQHTARWVGDRFISFYYNNVNLEHELNVSLARQISVENKNSIWEFPSHGKGGKFCDHYGSTQRLPNGNTLISHGCGKPEVLEVNKEGKIVWLWTPSLKDFNGNTLEIYRVSRVSREKIDRWMKFQF